MFSSNFLIQHYLVVNGVTVLKTASAALTIYLRKGDNIEVRVRRENDVDGYVMKYGVIGDGQNAQGSIRVYPVYEADSI